MSFARTGGEAARRDLRIGVCVGTTVGCVMSDEPFCRTALAHDDPDMEIFSLKLRNNPADVVARAFALAGPRQTVVNACSSGTDAIGIGASWIRAGVCDVVLAGGTDEIGRSTYLGFASLMISDDSPCKPFDVRRKGLNLGEGAGFLVLESDAALRRRGGRARARVVGYGSSADAYHPTAPRPDGAGLRRALAETLATAGASSADVAFVNAHGTGTQDNDRVEGTVLADVLPGVPYFSTKGATGHTLGAAGAVEAVFTAACLIRGSIPPSAGFEQPDPAIPHGPTKEARAVSGPLALSTSLAFGGNNAVIAIGVVG
jgi:3-oxoacyl-(acyl-carrier-protein) synthase